MHMHRHDGASARLVESAYVVGTSASRHFSQDFAFIFPPPSTLKEARIIAILDDSEDREEEDELHGDGKSATGISHAATCARPRAPGIDCSPCANCRAAFCKHFAWSLQERHIVLRVFRV